MPDPPDDTDMNLRSSVIHLKKAPSYYPNESGERFMFKLSHEEMVRRFGAAHRCADEQDGEPGACEYWGYDIDRSPTLLVFHFDIPDGPAAIVATASTGIDRLIDTLDVRELVTWRLDADD